MDHPQVTHIMRTGYPKSYTPLKPEPIIRSSTACQVCDIYEAEIKYNNTLLCSECASEVNIKLL